MGEEVRVPVIVHAATYNPMEMILTLQMITSEVHKAAAAFQRSRRAELVFYVDDEIRPDGEVRNR